MRVIVILHLLLLSIAPLSYSKVASIVRRLFCVAFFA